MQPIYTHTNSKHPLFGPLFCLTHTVNAFQWHLTVKLVTFMSINSLLTPLYFAYWVRDLDKVGAQLGSLLVVGAVLQNLTEYVVPWMTARGSRPKPKSDDDERSSTFFNLKSNKVMDIAVQPGDSTYVTKRRMSNKDVIVEIGRMASSLNFEKDALVQQNMTSVVEKAKGSKKGAGADNNGTEQDEVAIGAEMDFKHFRESRPEIRYEILSEVADTTVEMAEMLLQYTLIMMFGGVWPLCGVTALILNFLEVRLDIWKFCMINRRPMAQRGGSLGRHWTQTFDIATIAGISNHSFMLFVSSDTLLEYFFGVRSLDIYYRVMLAFLAQSGFLIIFLALRLTTDADPVWIVQSRKDALRYVRDAYRQAQQIRERRRQLMAKESNVKVPLDHVAATLDLDLESVNRYLAVARYLDGLSGPERRAILLDPHATVQGLVQKLELLQSTGQWRDPGEPATLPGLEHLLLPVTDIGKAYKHGRRFRELCYAAAERVSRKTPALSAQIRNEVILSVRQIAAVELDITLPQAERYCRLVRYVDSLPGNPYQVIDGLRDKFPGGIEEVLRDAKGRGWEDLGEPSPFELGEIIEPETSARKACGKAAVARRRMYDLWVHDSHLLHAELIEKVAVEMGGLREQLERYLLIRRYTDSLETQRRKELLELAKASTLTLESEIKKLQEDGEWRDPGEKPLENFDPTEEERLIAHDFGGGLLTVTKPKVDVE